MVTNHAETRVGRALRPILGGSYPKLVDHADRFYVLDDQGHRYLDAAAGVGVLALGYEAPDIVDAMQRQARALPYAHALRFASEPAEDLANELAQVAPPGFNSFSFTSGGSEAVEVAMKVARQFYWERGEYARDKFIGRWGSFHGNTLATQAVGGHLARRQRHLPLLLDFPHVSPPNCYRCNAGDLAHHECADRLVDELRLTIQRSGPETIAGVIIELVSGASMGALCPPPGYLAGLRKVCDEFGILLIVDEVYTSMGRTGAYFASDDMNADPDLIAMGKGMSAGFAPLGGVAVHDRVLEAFERGSGVLEHNFTFAGHPIACAAGAAAVRALRACGAPEAAQTTGKYLRTQLSQLLELHVVGDVRGRGLMMGIEFVKNSSTKEPFSPEVGFAQLVASIAMQRGLITYPGTGTVDGIRGDHILLTPPLVIERNHVDEIVAVLGESIQTAMERVGNR